VAERLKMTITEAFEAYRSDIIVFQNQSKKTEENHYVALRSLISYLGDIDVEFLSFEMVRDWKLWLDTCRSSETVRNYIIKLRVVLVYLQKKNIKALDADLIPVPKRQDKVPSFLSKEEVQLCIDATKRIKNKAIISLLYASGIRVSELCSLNRGDHHNGTFTVVGKGGKARLCFIDERTKELCRAYYRTREDNNPAIFLTDQGKRITPGTIQETFKSIRARTGLNVHPHTLRHSFATNLLQTNTNLYHVSRMLGHAQLSTTQQYLHVVDADLHKVYREHHTI
jgi:integrase/recombinase XerD